MDILATIRKWAAGLAETAVSLMALAITVQILMGSSSVPFLGDADVIGNVSSILATLGGNGLIGLVALYVLHSIWKSRK
ncbi:MAG: hypothetical protein HQ470_02365 [Methylophilales bacterium]|nr:hypothetical protein [Pseudomonadota bacterium]NQW34634.1 hypothetical protein [Methylophilales bacterium]